MNLKILHFCKNKSMRYCYEVFYCFFFSKLKCFAKNSQGSLKSNIPILNGTKSNCNWISFPRSKRSLKGLVNLRHLAELLIVPSPIQSYSMMVVFEKKTIHVLSALNLLTFGNQALCYYSSGSGVG